MRTIKKLSIFKKDYKRELKGRHKKILELEFECIIEKLIKDQPLEDKYKDHSLNGKWNDHRDCHIRPDLILVYRKTGKNFLHLVRIGSHSELGL